MQHVNDPQAPSNTRNSIELLNISMDRLMKLMTRLSGTNLYMKKMEMDEEGFVPVGIDIGLQAAGFDEEKAGNVICYICLAEVFLYQHATFQLL